LSLNWKEIDLVLSELHLEGAQIQKIAQPTFDSIVLGLWGQGGETELLISIAHGACRIHSLSRPLPKNERPLRFMECLRSRLRGGRIVSLAQLGRDRTLRFDIVAFHGERDDGEAGPARVELRLYARLWSGSGNLILCDAEDRIVDALARRPKRGEMPGKRFVPVLPPREGEERPERLFEVRDLSLPEGREEASFNERVEALYARSGGGLSRDSLLALARERFGKRRRLLETRIVALEAQAASFREADRNRELGDLIMANLGSAPEGRLLAVDDFYRGGRLHVTVDPALSLVANATAYYEKAKKESGGLAEVERELGRWRSELAASEAELARLEGLEDPLLIAKALDKGGTTRVTETRRWPGLSLERSGWTILVGRSAKENDELLRRHVRGSDLWLHARDWAGSYVFVKARKGKSVPLDILLDAGNLALHYSKGREAGEGDLYYTFVKYLRRAKDGPKGLVIPTQEKNLHVRMDEGRIKELRALIGADSDT